MRKLGWGGTLFGMGLALAAAAVPANANYVLSMVLPAGAPTSVGPGDSVKVLARLTGPELSDSMGWSVGVVRLGGAPALEYLGYLFEPVAYATSGADDFSVPKAPDGTGRFPAGTAAPAAPSYSALSRAGQAFNPATSGTPVGTVAVLDFKVPLTAGAGQSYRFDPLPDEFTQPGGALITATAGSSLTITVPEPATLVLLGLGGLAAVRRRLLGA